MHTIAEVKIAYRTTFNVDELPSIKDSKTAFDAIYPMFDQDTIAHRETFVVMFVNKANKFIGWKTLSQGGIDGTVVDVKILFQYALLMNASAIIVAHNHPSGSLLPSQADENITKRIKNAGQMLDMPLLDHLIVTFEGKYYSFADESKI